MQDEALGDCIAECLSVLSSWMNEHFLFLNTWKTNILVRAPSEIQDQITVRGIIYESSCIRFVTSAKI